MRNPLRISVSVAFDLLSEQSHEGAKEKITMKAIMNSQDGAVERKRPAFSEVTEKRGLSDSLRLSFVPAFCTESQ